MNVNTPRIVAGSRPVHDITENFIKTSSGLRTGQLVKNELFTLFEAVGALEIMDPKMDSGFLNKGETLEDGYDVLRRLLPEEVIGIMDQLMCREAAWHLGNPLSQTVYTSIYVDRLLWPVPQSLDAAQFDREGKAAEAEELISIVLRAYCLALIKSCDIVLMRITSEFFYEEEDFVTQTYHRTLLSNVEAKDIQATVDSAISWLEQSAVAEELRTALLSRLQFRKEFLSALMLDAFVVTRRTTAPFDSCLDRIDDIKRTNYLGKPVEEAFSIKIQRRLASTVPPKPMVDMTWTKTLELFTRLCKDSRDCQQLLDYAGPADLMTGIWALQSRKPQPSPYVRSLAQTIILRGVEMLENIPVKRFVYDSLEELVLPGSVLLDPANERVEMPTDPRFKIAACMDDFVRRMAQPFVDLYRSTCLNRCRVRRTMCHAIVDWDQLQFEAEDMDVQLQILTGEQQFYIRGSTEPTYAFPLSSWTYHQKLRQIRLIIELGFEQEICATEELPGIYWYLAYISAMHLGHLDRIRVCVEAAARRPATGPSSSAKKAESEAHRRRKLARTGALIDRLTTELIAVDAFASALHTLLLVLARHDALPSASAPSHSRAGSSSSHTYVNPKLAYELRMKPFFPISLPQVVPYELFARESTLPHLSDAALLERGRRAVAEGRRALETTLTRGPWVDSGSNSDSNGHGSGNGGDNDELSADWTAGVKNSLRACIGTSLAISVVGKAVAAMAAERGGGAGTKQDEKGQGKTQKEANGEAKEKEKGQENGSGGTKAETETETETPRPPLSLRERITVNLPGVEDPARWHAWWAVPRVSEKKTTGPAPGPSSATTTARTTIPIR